MRTVGRGPGIGCVFVTRRVCVCGWVFLGVSVWVVLVWRQACLCVSVSLPLAGGSMFLHDICRWRGEGLWLCFPPLRRVASVGPLGPPCEEFGLPLTVSPHELLLEGFDLCSGVQIRA